MAENKGNVENGAKSIDPAALEVLERAQAEGISTAFSRVDAMKACPIGADGACCRICNMGPCRLVGKKPEEAVGICGATLATVTARNITRTVAAGSAAHSDHGRDLAFVLQGVAKGEIEGFQIKDVKKLKAVATDMSIATAGRETNEIALDVANRAIDCFGNQRGELIYLSRAPQKRQEIWRRLGIAPRGIDREIVEVFHRTHQGTDQDYKHILNQAMRASLGDGWGGAMLATDISDILFGTPNPLLSQVNLGVLKDDEVNIVVHGHEPALSEMIVQVANDDEMIEYAKSKGANGINLTGICCTANEILMRHGIPPAGNFLHQELAIITGSVEAMIVDVQCIMQSLVALSERYHTKIITTSAKARIEGATHISFDDHNPIATAKLIVKTAIDNYPNRKREAVKIPQFKNDLVAGFSHEYVNYMLGGQYRASFRPLNDAIIDGRIQGVVGIVGCNNPRMTQDAATVYLTKKFIENDYLVVQTGCAAHACAKVGLLTPEAMEMAGPGLRSICEAVGIPPVLHLGSCVDNSRILTIVSEMVREGGLGDDISDLPAAGLCPEWMSEKAIAIGVYFVASGAYVIFGGQNPVGASEVVSRYISEGWEELVGGKLEFEKDIDAIYEKTVAHIQKKRQALGIDVKKERELFDMEKRRQLSV